MNHSQKPSIDILTEAVKIYDCIPYDNRKPEDEECLMLSVSLLQQIQSLPQSPSVESLLEEMGASMHQMRDGSRDWKAYIQLDNFDTYHEAYGKTPILALLALKEKLNNNNQ